MPITESTLEVIPDTIPEKLHNMDWQKVAFTTGESVEYTVYRNYKITEAHCFYLLAVPTSGPQWWMAQWGTRPQIMRVFLGTDFIEVYRTAVNESLRLSIGDFS